MFIYIYFSSTLLITFSIFIKSFGYSLHWNYRVLILCKLKSGLLITFSGDSITDIIIDIRDFQSFFLVYLCVTFNPYATVIRLSHKCVNGGLNVLNFSAGLWGCEEIFLPVCFSNSEENSSYLLKNLINIFPRYY